MSKLLRRLATVGSLFLGVISILPIAAKDVLVFLMLLPLVDKSLDHYLYWYRRNQALEGYLLKRKYVGFMDRTE